MAFFLPLDQSIYSFIIFYLFMANTGMAAADTALDGMILDVVPKRKLGTVQGWTWSLLMLGNAAAAAIGFAFYILKIIPLLFLITGLTMIVSCILPYFITEPPLGEELHILEDTKRIVTEKTNYKVFGYTFISTIAYPIILSSMTYLTLITMGVVQVDSAILSLSGGQTTEAYIIYSVIFGVFCGGGIVIGSFLAGKILDKKRIWAVNFTFLVYIPFCLISNLFLGFYFGLAAQIIFGLSYGALTISGQTIRGDIAKRRFPNLKSTFYALLISISNLGQSVGQYIGSILYSSLSNLFDSFRAMHFTISLFSAIILLISYCIFRQINPTNYEFEQEMESNKIYDKKTDKKINAEKIKTEKS
jgi:MFS family permease